MSGESFERIEHRLHRLETGQDALRADVAGLKSDVAELKADVGELKSDVAGLKSDVVGLKADVVGLKANVDDLGREMRVLHEDAVERIKAIPEYTGPTRKDFLELRELLQREVIEKRLDPLTAMVRQHHIDIEELKRRHR